MRTWPLVGLRIPASDRSVVVLPAPLGPMRPTISPDETVKRQVVDRHERAVGAAEVFEGQRHGCLTPYHRQANVGSAAGGSGRSIRNDDREIDILGSNRVPGGSDKSGGFASGWLCTLETNLRAPAGVLRIVPGEMSIQDVPQIPIDLLFDLLELASTAIPGATLDHGQHDAARHVVERNQVDDGRVLNAGFAEFSGHLLSGHPLQGVTVPVLSLGVPEVLEYVATHASALKAHRQSLRTVSTTASSAPA